MGEIVAHLGGVQVEFSGHRMKVVAALRNGERDNFDGGVGHGFDHRLGVFRGKQVVHHAANHPRLIFTVRVLDHEGVKVVLCGEGLLHAFVAGHDPHAHNAPIQRFALVHQRIYVHRLMGTMKTTDANMDDARRHGLTIIGRRLNRRAEGTHIVVIKLGHRHSPGYWLGKRVLAPALVRWHAAGFYQRGVQHVFLVGALKRAAVVLAHTEPAVHQPLYEHGIVHVDK